MISSFSGEYRFLSNFWLCQIPYKGFVFPSTENAYQWAKSETLTDDFVSCTPGKAKRLGQKTPMRKGWDLLRLKVMQDITRSKYNLDEILKQKLIDTDDEELVEGNTWNDTFWGQCPIGNGKNFLGKTIMMVRSEIQGKAFY